MIVKYFLRHNNAKTGTVTKNIEENEDFFKTNMDIAEKINDSISILQKHKKRALRSMKMKIFKNKEWKVLSVNIVVSLQQG